MDVVKPRFLAMSLLILILACCGPRGLAAAAEQPDKAGKPEKIEPLRFSVPEAECRNRAAEVCRRLAWPDAAMKEALEKSGSKIPNAPVRTEENFQAVVPKEFAPNAKGWGLLVWISPSESGDPPPAWLDALGRRKLIWVAPDHAGNERLSVWRMGLALQAVAEMRKKYPMPPGRTYVAGRAGGGMVASMLGVAFPDTFDGGLYLGGCNFYRDVPLPRKAGAAPGGPARTWPKTFDPPPLGLLRQAKTARGHVLLSAANDPGREQVKAVFESGFKDHGFKRATYLEAPKFTAGLPSAEWLDKALGALEPDPKSPSKR